MHALGEWPRAVCAGVGRLLARYAVDLAVQDAYVLRLDNGDIIDCVDIQGDSVVLPVQFRPLVERVLERSSLLMIDDLQTDSVVGHGASSALSGSFLGVGAVNEAGQMVGVVLAHGSTPRSWSNRDLERAGDIAQSVASILILDELWRHAESRVDAEVRAREIRLQMHTISTRSASASSVGELSRILVAETPQLVRASWVIVGVRQAETEWTVHVSPDHAARCEPAFGGKEALGNELLDHVASLDAGRVDISADDVEVWPEIRTVLGHDESLRLVGACLAATDDLSMVLLCGFATHSSSLQVDYVFDEMLSDVRRAIERTAAAQRQIQAASDLQRSLLPPRVPALDGFDIARLYKSAADHTRVGGDWYDIVRIDSATTGFVVGDVAGHDIRSAAQMGQLRHVLASQLRDRRRPAGALLATDRYFADLAENVMATAVVIVVDQVSRVAHVALAGHPPPVIMREGNATFVQAPAGPPIGFGYGDYRDTMITLQADDIFIAYTDGVVENRTGNLAVLLDEFLAALDGSDASTVNELVSVLNQRSQLGELVDDVASLVVRIT